MYHIQQGVVVRTHDVFDNQHATQGRKRKKMTFLSLDEIQRSTNEKRPYFPIETMHHTLAWRQSSALDKYVFLDKNKDIMLHENLRVVARRNPSLEEDDSSEEAAEAEEHNQDFEPNEDSSLSYRSSPSGDDEQPHNFDENEEEERGVIDDNQENWDSALKRVFVETIAIQNHHSRLLFSDETICLTDLYATLNRRGIPATLFDTLSKWAWNNRKLLCKMNEPPMKRKKYLKHISSTVRGSDKAVKEFRPKRTLIQLSSGRQVYVTTIGFENMIKDLLSNTTLMRPEHILWDEDKGNTLSEVNSGHWWSAARTAECLTEMDVLWPLVMFIDGMKISNLGSLRLEPITFTFSRFKRNIRYQGNAWRTAAFIEEVHQVRGVDEDISARDKLQDYHDILNFIFSELVEVQRRGIAWSFSEHCGELSNRRVVLRLPIQLIIGDCEGHDKLCGRYKSHSQNVKGLCRDCDIPTREADNVDWKCNFRSSFELENMNVQQLGDISFYPLDNALHSLSFASTVRGFFAALLAENLHVIKGGLVPVMFDGIWSSLSKKGMNRLHYGARHFVNIHKSIEKHFKGLPPINAFRYGLTSDKAGGTMTLDSSERFGRIFVMYCLLTISPVAEYICRHQKRGTDYNYTYWSRIVHILEMTLSFEAWVCSEEHEEKDIIGDDGSPESSTAHMRIRQFLHMTIGMTQQSKNRVKC
jgi:hypothetical protein